MSSSSFLKVQSGFTLVEMMIASVLGIALMGAVVQLVIENNRDFQLQENIATMQENGRFSLMFLKRLIRQGGYSGKIGNWKGAIVFSGDNGSKDEGAEQKGDSVVVAFEAKVDGVQNKDCAGNLVVDGKVENRLYVSDNGKLAGNLVCKGNGEGSDEKPSTSISVVEGIDYFQVLYGIEQVDSNKPACHLGVVNQFLNATEVVKNKLQNRVVSVQVALLFASKNDLLPAVTSKNYSLLDKTFVANDKKNRKIFKEIVFMPNAMFNIAGSPISSHLCAMSKKVKSKKLERV